MGTVVSAERAPSRTIQREPLPNREVDLGPSLHTGVARFAAGPAYFNPDRQNYHTQDVQEAIRLASPESVDFFLVEQISNEQRQARAKQGDIAAFTPEQQMKKWLNDSIIYFQTIKEGVPQDMVNLLHERLGINVRGDYNHLWERSAWLWNTFLREGSEVEDFVRQLTADVADNPDARIKRILMARPLFGMFGYSEAQILSVDAALAQSYLSFPEKDLFAEVAARVINTNFLSPEYRNAYALAWDKVKNNVIEPPTPEEPARPETPPPSRREEERGPAETKEKEAVAAKAPIPPEEPSEQRAAVIPPAPLGEMKEEETMYTYEVAQQTMEKPGQGYSADRTVAEVIAGGKSVVFGAIDGLGTGGKHSEQAAEFMKQELEAGAKNLTHKPNVDEGIQFLLSRLKGGALRVEEYKKAVAEEGERSGNPISQLVLENIGAVFSGGIECERKNGEAVVVTVNIGDARSYIFIPDEDPDNMKLVPITSDQTIAAGLQRSGTITPEQAFKDQENKLVVYKSVTVQTLEEIEEKLKRREKVEEIQVVRKLPRDRNLVFFSVTDGWTDNTPPDWELDSVKEAYNFATQNNREFSPEKFIEREMERLRTYFTQQDDPNLQLHPLYNGEEFVKPDDVGIAAVYRKVLQVV